MGEPITTGQPAVWRRIEDGAPRDGTRIIIRDTEKVVAIVRWDSEFSSSWSDETDDLEHTGAWTDDTVASWGYEERNTVTPVWWLPLDALPPPPGEGDGGGDA